jgi:nitrogen fixation NifU-like protein
MSDTYTLYNQTVMDHFLNPRNMGDLDNADGVGEVGAAACGDIMKISLRVEQGRIQDARFKTFGCGSAIASSSMATELIKGRTVEEALSFTNQEVVNALGGLPPVKIHCSVLAEEAIKAALEDYLKRHPAAAKPPGGP